MIVENHRQMFVRYLFFDPLTLLYCPYPAPVKTELSTYLTSQISSLLVIVVAHSHVVPRWQTARRASQQLLRVRANRGRLQSERTNG